MEAQKNNTAFRQSLRMNVACFLYVCTALIPLNAYAATYGQGIYGFGLYNVGQALMAPTSLVLTSSTNPSVTGASITLTATIDPAVATGSIALQDGTMTIATSSLGHGSGTFITNSLTAGSHSLTVAYAGNTSYEPSISNTVTQIVNVSTQTYGQGIYGSGLYH